MIIISDMTGGAIAKNLVLRRIFALMSKDTLGDFANTPEKVSICLSHFSVTA
jgi:hypothetical protein